MNHLGNDIGAVNARAGAILGGAFNNAITQQTAQLPPVQAAQEHLDKCIAVLYNELDALTQRLQPILGPSTPVGVEGDNAKAHPSVANRINVSAAAVNNIAQRIRDLRERLEI